jgi:hypothetical protein
MLQDLKNVRMVSCWVHDGVKGVCMLGLKGATPLGDVIIDIKSDKRYKECHGYNA